MPIEFSDLIPGARIAGVVPDGPVSVVFFAPGGDTAGTLTYRDSSGLLNERIVTSDDIAGFDVATERRWSFDADGGLFRLASEARRLKNAHLSDPFAAVDTSGIEPYPHQIEAVYEKFLEQRPLRYLLADDPGAGKTIMSGLLIRELLIRGDVARCLIVAPGSLVEQWQDELGSSVCVSTSCRVLPLRNLEPGTRSSKRTCSSLALISWPGPRNSRRNCRSRIGIL